MKILDIAVDGFGIWKDLKLDDLSETVTVVYGRNEAGKTTLMQFVRTMLYGLSPKRRRRYVPPVHGGQPGGALRIKTPSGSYVVTRHLSIDHRSDEPFAGDDVMVTDDNGNRQGGHALSVLLSGVDELTYSNVYAVGLREIQELGTLSDTDAARHLYDLSAGLDRVSLVEILRELRRSREHLLGAADQDSKIEKLCRQRQQAQSAAADQIQQSLGRYRNLTSERNRLGQQIVGMEKERDDLERRGRVTEVALSVHDKWLDLKRVRRELKGLGEVEPISDAEVERVAQLGEQARTKQRQQRKLKVVRQQRRDQAAAFPINEALRQHGPRIEALVEQRDWILSLDRRIDELDAEIDTCDAEYQAGQKRLGSGAEVHTRSKKERSEIVAALRSPARGLSDAKRRLEQHESRIEATPDETPDEKTDEIAAALAARDQNDLDTALQASADRVDLHRQRLEVHERLERLEQQHEEVREDHNYLEERQILPSWGLAAAGFAFALGVMMLLIGVFSIFAGSGWPFVLIGMALVTGVVVGKLLFERAADHDLDACERQLEGLTLQIKKAREQREVLDGELPKNGGPLIKQLREAENELADLQSLLPLRDKKYATQQASQVAQRRADGVRGEYQEAKRVWHRALHDAGLPANFSPKQIRDLFEQSRGLVELKNRIDRCREESQQRRRELSSCAKRVEQMLTDAGFETFSDRLVDQVDQLKAVLTEQQQLIERREDVVQEGHELRRRQLAVSREIVKLKSTRRAMLEEVGAENLDEYRTFAADYARSLKLTEQGEKLQNEIHAAVADVCEEEVLDAQLEGFTTEQIERRWESLANRLQQVDDRLKDAFEKRGRLAEQLRVLGEDRRAAHKQLELNCIEQQLREAVARWQELAVTTQLLDSIRRRYEQERQPATLREASRYLQDLTEGRYQRIWTVLDEDALRVDDADGKSFTPEMLSRGTREQLFLALRLSLVALYAQRGVQLPLVLDDVFVNFDSERARAAASVLRSFAKLGHQVLIFTCHEHILEIFAGVDADTRRLPGQSAAAPKVVTTKPRKRKPVPELPVQLPEPEPVTIAPVIEKPAEPKPKPVEPPKKPEPAPKAVEPPPPPPIKQQPAAKPAPTPPPPPPRPKVKPRPAAKPAPPIDAETTWEADDEEVNAARYRGLSGPLEGNLDEGDVLDGDAMMADSDDKFGEAA